MKFSLQGPLPFTVVPPELIEIYQPVIGFEAVSLWVNLYHGLINGFTFSDSDIIQQMNISQKSYKTTLKTLTKYCLLKEDGKGYIIALPSIIALQEQVRANIFDYELGRRFITLLEAFCLRRGQALGLAETAAAGEEDNNALTPQLADELATRFIKECKFKPTRELRDRFDFWFDQLKDRRLLEELLARTKNRVEVEGTRGSGCPSRYADKIVSQWLVQGVKTYEDLLRSDQEFQGRCEFYRVAERELGRGHNTLTPSEREIVDSWSVHAQDASQLSRLMKEAILSGEYQGKGAPSIAFVNKWLNRKGGQAPPPGKKEYAHKHKMTDIDKLVQRKTMVDLEDEVHEE